MSKIIPFITGANDNLVDQVNMLQDAVKIAEEYTFPRLDINWDINVVLTNHIYDIVIPEDGVGGRTYTSDFIIIALDERRATMETVAEMLVHELCHAARWGKNDEWANTLLDSILNEGIATTFQAEFAKTQSSEQVFLSTVTSRTDEENLRIKSNLAPQFDNANYNYAEIFFHGNNDLPRWSGYSLGYYLIKQYLDGTHKSITDAYADKYQGIKEF